MVKHKAKDNEFYDTFAQQFRDLYGNEIEGLRDAKTKEEQIAALEAHLIIIIDQANDVECNIERRIAVLKYGTKYS